MNYFYINQLLSTVSNGELITQRQDLKLIQYSNNCIIYACDLYKDKTKYY